MENDILTHAGVKGMKWGIRKAQPDTDGYSGQSGGSSNPYGRVLNRNALTSVNRISQMAIVGGLTYGGARMAKKRGKKVAAATLATIGTLSVSGLGAAMIADLASNNTRDLDVEHGELAHAGIKGMRWGIRRYQNKDGSLTPAGRKRYADYHEDYRRAHSKKSIKEMSDRELRERNNRLQMEKQYNDLTHKKGRGKKIVNAFVSTAGTITAVAGAYATYKTLASKGIDKIGDWAIGSINLNNLHG